MIYEEEPSGTYGGTVFTLTYTPAANSLQLYLNGLLLVVDAHYTLVGNTITLFDATVVGDWLRAFYSEVNLTATGTMVEQLEDIAQWAAVTQLTRPELLEQAIAAAKSVYNLVCTRIPFDELQATSNERPMVAGTSLYNISDLEIAGIVSIRMTQATNTFRRWKRSHVRLYDGMSSVTNGIPATYARWGKNIEVMPPPQSSAYTYRIRYWSRPSFTPLVRDTAILTPPEWNELYRWETLYRLYYALEQYDKAASLMMITPMPRVPEPKRRLVQEVGIIPRLWNDLLQTVSQRENVDEDFGIVPSRTSYTTVRNA